MSKMNDGSMYIFKLIAIILIVIINIIAIIAVVTAVGGALKNLKRDIASGKISNERIVSNESTYSQGEDNDISINTEMDNSEDDMELDFGKLFKIVMADKNARKSVILMTFALILLAGAIFTLVKLK